MLPQKNRISRRSFDDVFTKGQFFGGEYLSGKVLNFDNNSESRFSCVVPKKSLKRAVDRNKLRRRVYSALSPLLSKIKPGFAIILFVKPSLLTVEFKDLQVMLINLLKHHNLIND